MALNRASLPSDDGAPVFVLDLDDDHWLAVVSPSG
jgi:hypothetical protein